ncbi:gliding motility-associated protein GldE [Flavobacteriaceae bacterium]|nr:gliding motility-associated protein GldE [Flavobacteriaceae bacterium]MDB4134678.1 gliding motility-associated protein GldE [Flavobacteriaceae bacterium]MDB4179771.1 gliding motility-associated protein GldE [Flavobacteriaceae bacterium]MDC1320913.1 gliding motility-associated protein GldE [Flavobacteriaceae bacterium]
MSDPIIYYSLILATLLIFSGMISGSEVALFSLSKSQLKNEDKSSYIQIIQKLLSNSNKLLATILVANSFINIAIVILFTQIGNVIFKSITSPFWQFTIEVVVATFLILLFGEILPKIYASRNNLLFSRFVIYPLLLLDFLLTPISLPMQKLSNFIKNKLSFKKGNINLNQISSALDLTSPDETTKQEHKILKGILSFGNTETKEVMRPRLDIHAYSNLLNYDEVLKNIIENNFSRIPVYNEDLDNIIGILYVKDLLPFLDKKDFDWLSTLRKPLFIPENKKLDDLMQEFQEKKIHLAIVVDEFGGTSGVISLEDVIEEIVGDISDEFDDDSLLFSKLDNLNYVFEGKTSMKDFYKILNIDSSPFDKLKGDSETIAGFILEISQSFPKINSKIVFENYTFTIESVDKKRIKQVKVTIK